MEKIKNGRYRRHLCRNWVRAFFLGFVFLISYTQAQAVFTFTPQWGYESTTQFFKTEADVINHVKSRVPSTYFDCRIGDRSWGYPTGWILAWCNFPSGSSYAATRAGTYYGSCQFPNSPDPQATHNSQTGTCTSNKEPSCPTGTVWDSSSQQCIQACGPNEIRNSAGQCQDECFASRGQITGYGSTPNGTGCYNGCTLGLYDSGYACALVDKPNQKLVCGKYYNTGMSCDGANDFFPPTSSTTKEYDCLTQGKTFGYVNGIPTCIAPATPTTTNNDSTTTKTNSDGSTTSTSTNKTTTDNGDGTVTTTKTTTTTTTPSGGGSPTTTTETETETEDKQSFCDENPDLTICKESSFGGGCGGDWTCEGDAIQCAMAKEQHTRNCELFDKETGLSKLGNQLAEGTDPLGETALSILPIN